MTDPSPHEDASAILEGRSRSADDLLAQLTRRRAGEAVITFDADGTLWSGDIGEDAFTRALTEGLIQNEALEALQQAATAFGLPVIATANEMARSLWVAYNDGRFPEREICELMTWCYAGWSQGWFRCFAARVVEEANILQRRTVELSPILDWARTERVRTLIVSASPRTLVEEAARVWGFEADDIVAATPAYDGDAIAPRTQGPIPYGAAKCELARPVIGSAQWLASFGDNVFDLEMLQAAEVGVAVQPKPRLQRLLLEFPDIFLLKVDAERERPEPA